MRGGHGRKRARTSDRDRVVEAITLAYVDGQIEAADRDERVARALTSTTIDGLRPLVADLQFPEHLRLPDGAEHTPAPPALPRTGRPRSWAESRQRFRESSRWEKAAVVTAVAVLPTALVTSAVLGGDGAGDELDLHSAAGIERFVEDLEAEFGTTEVLELELNDTWARVYVVEGDGRYRYHTYGSSWDPDDAEVGFRDGGSGGTTQDDDPDLVDLADLDADRLVANIERARSELGVDGDVDVAVIVADERMATDFGTQEPFATGEEDAPPHVEIEVSNEYMETATLTTDLTGVRYLARDPLA